MTAPPTEGQRRPRARRTTRVGEVIAGRFALEELLGRGGMGKVYHATDLTTGAKVAVKLVEVKESDDAARFAREAEALAALSHPGIVRYVAHGTTVEREVYLAMERLDGETLADRLARGPLPVDDALRLVRRVTDALAAVHRRGLVHRDVKPSNLVLVGGALDRVKLIDFGIARRVADRPDLTQRGVILGTVGYMAPEQVRGLLEVDARADVFALGSMLHECLTGRPVFPAKDMIAILARIILEEAPRAREACPDLPDEVDALLGRMLAKDPRERPRDAGALLGELDALTAALADRITPARLRELAAAREVATTAPFRRVETLTGNERRTVCIVLVGGERVAPAFAPTLPAGGDAGALLRAEAARFAVHLEVMIDGSAVGILDGTGTATDRAVQAARCALALAARFPDAPIALVIGRAVVVGKLPIGDVIDRGVALLRREGERAIRIDDVTAGLLESRFVVSRGEDGHRLRGELDAPEAPRLVLGRATPFLGREREIGLIEQTLAGCVEQREAACVLVTAAAGGGKSRLRHEFLRGARAEGLTVLVGHGDELTTASPFGLLTRALRGAAGIAEGEPAEAQRRKLERRVSAHLPDGPARASTARFLAELAALGEASAAEATLVAAHRDASIMRDAMLGAWLDWLEAECAAGPVLLVLEDLHSADLPSVQFVDAALRHLRDAAFMVLALARPTVRERFPDLWAGRQLQEVTLPRLSRKTGERLIREVLGATSPAIVERVVARADGNPFFLEELARAVAAGKLEELPDTVLGTVQARLDALGGEAKRVLRAASVFGETFWPGGVAALVSEGMSAAAIAGWLEELERREVIARRRKATYPGEVDHVFAHALVRDAAYAMLTEDDCRLGHRLAGDWLEQRGERDPIILAEHLDRGGEPGRAIEWYRRAADHALEGNDLAAAFRCAGRGIDCGAEGETLGALYFIQAMASSWRGEAARAEQLGLQAIALFRPGQAAWFRAIGEVISASGHLVRYDEVERWGQLASATAAEAGAGPDQIVCLAHAAGMLSVAARTEAAEGLHGHLDALVGDLSRLELRVAARVHQARTYRHFVAGDAGAALESSRAGYEASRAAGDLRTACTQQSDVGCCLGQVGDLAAAEEAFGQALAVADRLQLSYVALSAECNLGVMLADQGRLDEARPRVIRALAGFRAQGDRRMAACCLIERAIIESRAGDPAAAEAAAHAALELGAAVGPVRCMALAVLARAILAQGRAGEALTAAREAVDLLEALGSEDKEALVRRVHVEALAATGARGEAEAALRRACQRIHERAERIRDPRWRLGFLEQVEENSRTLALERSWRGPAS